MRQVATHFQGVSIATLVMIVVEDFLHLCNANR